MPSDSERSVGVWSPKTFVRIKDCKDAVREKTHRMNAFDRAAALGRRRASAASRYEHLENRVCPSCHLEQLRPRTLIVLGKRMWDRMPETVVYLSDDIQAYRLQNRETVICWAIEHPAIGMGWERLSSGYGSLATERWISAP